jgi:outer membrane lipoprotein-sorting protein
VNILRRLPLYRLLLLCGVVIAGGVSAAALAFALGSGAKPPAKPLAQAVHDALRAPAPQGVSANIKLTNRLIEGAQLASDSGLSSSPLLTGASGRLWIASDGRARLELQTERGDTQIVSDGHTLSLYDAATNTLYRYTPPASADDDKSETHSGQVPSLADIEHRISDIERHASLSGAIPANVAGEPAYTVRVAPNEKGSLIGGAELSFDAADGAPLRAAVYSTASTAPVIELAATEVSFGPIDPSVLAFTPPPDAKVQELHLQDGSEQPKDATTTRPKLTTKGTGPSTVAILQSSHASTEHPSSPDGALEGLPKVDVNGAQASELRTELGTLLTFERSGVRYVLAGSVSPGTIEALARGL